MDGASGRLDSVRSEVKKGEARDGKGKNKSLLKPLFIGVREKREKREIFSDEK